MSTSKQAGTDFAALAEALDEMRENLRAMVAAVMADGFTEEQARIIVTGLFASIGKTGDSDEQST